MSGDLREPGTSEWQRASSGVRWEWWRADSPSRMTTDVAASRYSEATCPITAAAAALALHCFTRVTYTADTSTCIALFCTFPSCATRYFGAVCRNEPGSWQGKCVRLRTAVLARAAVRSPDTSGPVHDPRSHSQISDAPACSAALASYSLMLLSAARRHSRVALAGIARPPLHPHAASRAAPRRALHSTATTPPPIDAPTEPTPRKRATLCDDSVR